MAASIVLGLPHRGDPPAVRPQRAAVFTILSLRRFVMPVLLAALLFATGCDWKAAGCCPRDPKRGGCTNLGGANRGACAKSCDFWCSTNWRVERDEEGCEVWRYDVRRPAAGENATCMAQRCAADAGCD